MSFLPPLVISIYSNEGSAKRECHRLLRFRYPSNDRCTFHAKTYSLSSFFQLPIQLT